jgi:hypothetical protein
MSLESAYTQVKRSRIFNGATSSGFMPEIQKDPTIMRLEQDVFSKMREVCPQETIQSNKPDITTVKVLSPEEALKELMEMEKAASEQK